VFVDILPPRGLEVLGLLSATLPMERFYLAGGTGLALQLGHRESYDLGFFSQNEFRTFDIIQALGATGHFRLSGEAIGTVHGFLNDVRVTFLHYPYGLLFPPIAFNCISIADPRDIGLMKITAISSRGSKKDFIDLHLISQQVIPLESLFGLMEKKYPSVDYSVYHLIRSLAYFDDADREPAPIMRSGVSWSETKDYFRAQQRSLIRKYLGPDDIGG
jgi:hypothetical protein